MGALGQAYEQLTGADLMQPDSGGKYRTARWSLGGRALPGSVPAYEFNQTAFIDGNTGFERRVRSGWFSKPIYCIPDDGGPLQLDITTTDVGGGGGAGWFGPFTLQQVFSLFCSYQTLVGVSTIRPGPGFPESPSTINAPTFNLSRGNNRFEFSTGGGGSFAVLGLSLYGLVKSVAGHTPVYLPIDGFIYWGGGFYISGILTISGEWVGLDSWGTHATGAKVILFGGATAGGVDIPLFGDPAGGPYTGTLTFTLQDPVTFD